MTLLNSVMTISKLLCKSNLGSIVWSGVPNATDLCQPVDGGFAEQLKAPVMQQNSSSLDTKENADRWYNGKISSKERHILISHWIGAAYKNISSKDYQSFGKRMFEKTGCLITADGSDNDKIKPEERPEYQVLPSCNYK